MDTTKLKRHPYTQAVINTDTASYRQHIFEEKKSRELRLALDEVNTLRSDVDDIKDMLRTLINGMNNNGKSNS
jgi:hypothetical protein